MAMTKTEEARVLAANMDIVTSIAKRHASFGVDFDDLVQEASIGFLKGIRDWSPEGGASLRTYAAQWATKYVRVAIGCNDIKLAARETKEVSLDYVSSGGSFHDVLVSETFPSPEEAAIDNERIQMVRDAAESLNARELGILKGTIQGESNETIGHGLGISRERVRQIKSDVVEIVMKRVAQRSAS